MSKRPQHLTKGQLIAVVAGAVAITYNIPGSPKLHLDDAALAGIYLGEIKKWNDPKIAGLNEGVKLPNQDIIVVHRSDGSGTSFIFTDYLSVVNKEWASKVGKATSVSWPAGVGAIRAVESRAKEVAA